MPLPADFADFIDRFRKPLFFAVVAAIGCLAMALIAELFLLFASQIAPPAISRGDQSPRYVCLTIDISGSMEGRSLTEVKKAASKFVRNRDFSRDNIAITVFSTDARVLVPLTNDKQKLLKAIDSIACEGLTNFNAALEKSDEAISPKNNPDMKKMATDAPVSILFFTDGMHCVGDPLIALAIAERLRTQEKIKILAVATDDADFDYLEALTGDKDSVISVRGDGFQKAFDEAERKIFSPQLMQSGSGESSNPLFVLLQVFVWSTLLCFGIAIGIVGMQNNFLQKQFMTPSVALGWLWRWLKISVGKLG